MGFKEIIQLQNPVFVTVVFLFMTGVIFFSNNELLKLYVDNVGVLLLAITAAVGFYQCHKKTDPVFKNEQKAWFFIFLAILLRVFGEFFLAFYEIVLNASVPALSLADLTWHLSYIAFFVGFIYTARHIFMPQKKAILTFIILVCIVIFAQYGITQQTLFTTLSQEEKITHLINFTYILWDILLLGLLSFLLIPILRSYNKFSQSYLLFILAFISFTIFDAAFAIQWNATEDAIEVFYYLGYLLLIYTVSIRGNNHNIKTTISQVTT